MIDIIYQYTCECIKSYMKHWLPYPSHAELCIWMTINVCTWYVFVAYILFLVLKYPMCVTLMPNMMPVNYLTLQGANAWAGIMENSKVSHNNNFVIISCMNDSAWTNTWKSSINSIMHACKPTMLGAGTIAILLLYTCIVFRNILSDLWKNAIAHMLLLLSNIYINNHWQWQTKFKVLILCRWPDNTRSQDIGRPWHLPEYLVPK